MTWLETDYKLTPNEAAVVAGTALRYDIAEIVDPARARRRKDSEGSWKELSS